MSKSAVCDDVIQKMESHLEEITPGMDASFTEACVADDAIWQGDLCIKIVEMTDDELANLGYKKVEKITKKDLQLVPEGGEGSRHILRSAEGVELFRPESWGQEDSLVGPVIRLNQANSIDHPRHGNVSIPAGFSVSCTYQREYDEEQKRERRARD